MSRIYFAGSIRGGREQQPIYAHIIAYLQRNGHTVLSEHVGKATVSAAGERALTDDEIYQRDLYWISQADAFVADVTIPSLGVGYEICYTHRITAIPVLCIAHEDANVSAMISGSAVKLLYYNHAEHAAMTVGYWLDTMGLWLNDPQQRDGAE